MSLHPTNPDVIPEETARLARTIAPQGTVYMQIRDHLGSVYRDASFSSLFSSLGQPAEAPWRLALVCIFQFIDGLTDRQAAEAVQQRIDWKYALALELPDPGFDYSVLCKFRKRLLAGKHEIHLFDTLLAQLKAQGLLKARGRQRTDATHVLAAVRSLNRLERVGETLRAALNSVAAVAPDWLRNTTPVEWYERYGHRMENYRFPKSEQARTELGATMGRDGLMLLQAVDAAIEFPWLRELPAVVLLRRVWNEQFTQQEGQIALQAKADLQNPAELVVSPYDPDARFSVKRGMEWIGYKVHFTEVCDEDAPHIITHVETTVATVPDEQVVDTIHQDLARHEVLPATHLVDMGYTDAEELVRSQQAYGITLLGPVSADAGWQAKAGEGFDKASFAIDWDRQQVTCPAGKHNYSWLPHTDRSRGVVGGVRVQFASRDCTPCSLRAQCTRRKSAPRELIYLPREWYEALRAAKQRPETAAFYQEYALRAGVESTHAQVVRRSEGRRSRYLGLDKTHLQYVLTAIALNLVRTVTWLTNLPDALAPSTSTRCSHFAALYQTSA